MTSLDRRLSGQEEDGVKFSELSLTVNGSRSESIEHPLPLSNLSTILVDLEPLMCLDSVKIVADTRPKGKKRSVNDPITYHICTPEGIRLYIAVEKLGKTIRCCNGHISPFLINLLNSRGRLVAIVERRNSCELRCFGAVGSSGGIQVRSGTGQLDHETGDDDDEGMALMGRAYGNVTGFLRHYWTYYVYDRYGNRVLELCGRHWKFKKCQKFARAVPLYLSYPVGLVGPQGQRQQVGHLIPHLCVTDQILKMDNVNVYDLAFPVELHPALKVILISTVFCLDISFYESRCCTCRGLRILGLSIFLIVSGTLVYFVMIMKFN